MKVLYDFAPANPQDTSITITASSEDAVFIAANLKEISPTQCWKSTDTVDSYVTYYKEAKMKINCLFLNRFNFAEFWILGRDDDSWPINHTDNDFHMHITGQTKDEIVEEYYMHYFAELENFEYKYLRIFIPAQTPLDPYGWDWYFKIGNLLIGNYVEIWNPKSGYTVNITPKNNVIEYDSGHISEARIGRTRRTFVGGFDKISNTEYNKIVNTRNPIVIYHDWEADPTRAYLVKAMHNYNRSYDFYNVTSHTFQFVEIV